MAAEMSDYERERLERIKQNNAMMLALGIDDAASQMRSADPKPRKPREPKVRGLDPQRPRSERSAAAEAMEKTKRQMAAEGATDELGYERRSRGRPSLHSSDDTVQPFVFKHQDRPSYSTMQPYVFNAQDRQILTDLVEGHMQSMHGLVPAGHQYFASAQSEPGELFSGFDADLW